MKIPEPKKLKSGTWFIQLRLTASDGRRVSVPVSAATKKECIRAAELIKAEHRSGRKTVRSVSEKTLRQAAEEYIEARRSSVRSPSTIEGYEKIIRCHFDGLWDMKLSCITNDILNSFVSAECKKKNRLGKSYSPKTIHNAYFFVISVLNEMHISHDGKPLLPEKKRTPVQILTAEEVYAAVKGTPIELPCLLAMWLTLSISEIRGLTKSKSLRGNQLSIVETIIDVGGEPVRKPGGKEEERSRTLTVPPYIMQLIQQTEGDVICPLSSQATNKRLSRLLEKNGLPHISFHKLRHISASTMAELGIQKEIMQERGGWKTPKVMDTVYTHVFDASRRQADRTIDEKFNSLIEKANEKANKK